MTRPTLLRGERLRLTHFTPEDVSTLARWHQDPEFLRLYDALPAFPKSDVKLKEWIETVGKAKDTFAFGVRLLDDDALLGHVILEDVLWMHGFVWMSYAIGDPASRGQGYGYEAVQLALKFAFHELNLHRVVITVFDYNQASLALAEKLGFQHEGVFREHLQRDGKRYDMHLFGILRHEWDG